MKPFKIAFIRLPRLESRISDGEITKIFVQKGESVEIGQPLIEFETDKSVTSIENSTRKGKVHDVFVSLGTRILFENQPENPRLGVKLMSIASPDDHQ